MDVQRVAAAMRSAADPVRAAAMSAYMRDQFVFLGVPRTLLATIAADFLRSTRSAPIGDVLAAARQLYALPEREFQYLAIDLFSKNWRRLPDCAQVVARIDDKPWWDSVDALRKPLSLWTKTHRGTLVSQVAALLGGSIWHRRVAITLQLQWHADTDRDLLAHAIDATRADPEFFIQKAIGWALRDYARTNPDWVRRFVVTRGLTGIAKREALKHIGATPTTPQDPPVSPNSTARH